METLKLNTEPLLLIPRSRLQQALLIALATVSLLTLAYYSFGFDWSYAYRSRSLLGAIFVFVSLAPLSVAPSGMLWLALRYEYRTWMAPVVGFILVVAPSPILFFVVWREGMEGFQYVLVPMIQSLIAFVLLLIAGNFRKRLPRNSPDATA